MQLNTDELYGQPLHESHVELGEAEEAAAIALARERAAESARQAQDALTGCAPLMALATTRSQAAQ